MPFPEYIPTRVVSVGGSAVLESGRLLRTVVELRSSKSLVWEATGYRFESQAVGGVSGDGSEVTFVLPRTDVQGWKDARTGSIIDVSVEGSYSHKYTATVSFQDDQGRKVAGSYTIGPFVLPAGDGVIDLDRMVPASSTAGDAILFPDWVSRVVADAQQAATDSANAAETASAALVDSAAFVDATAAAKIADPSSAMGAAVGGKVASEVAAGLVDVPTITHAGVAGFPSVVFLGDSNFAIGSNAAGRQYGESVPTLACWKANGRLIFADNAGVASDTVQMMNARLQADVIDKHPAVCVILAGSNSTTKGVAHWNDAKATYEVMIQRLMRAGVLPALCTIPPRDGSRTAVGGTYGEHTVLINRLTLAWNTFVRSLAAKYRLPLIDIYALVADPDTGNFKTNWAADGVHWIGFRSHDVAQLIADTLTPLFPFATAPLARDRETTNAGTVDGPNFALNWYQDGLFMSPFNQGTGGRYPYGFNGSTSSALTVSQVDPTAGDPLTAGKWMRLQKTGAASVNVNAIRTLNQITNRTGVVPAAGQRIGFGFAYKIENAANGGYVTVSIAFRNSSGGTIRSTTPINQHSRASSGVVWVEDVIPDGTIDIRADFGFGSAGECDLWVGQLTGISLDGLGIPSFKASA